MKNKEKINAALVTDSIKQTLNASNIPLYEWMLGIGLRQADLLVYAALFDELRREPLKPMSFNLSDVARRIHYTRCAVYQSIDSLCQCGLLYKQGEKREAIFSLYPFDTLDLK